MARNLHRRDPRQARGSHAVRNDSRSTTGPLDEAFGPREARPPRVSIGLPVFNGEAYLDAAIESLLAQDFTDFELIVCDNASTDNTPAIAAAWAAKDSRVLVYRNETNVGAEANF